jgi:hypothetical protein
MAEAGDTFEAESSGVAKIQRRPVQRRHKYACRQVARAVYNAGAECMSPGAAEVMVHVELCALVVDAVSKAGKRKPLRKIFLAMVTPAGREISRAMRYSSRP